MERAAQTVPLLSVRDLVTRFRIGRGTVTAVSESLLGPFTPVDPARPTPPGHLMTLDGTLYVNEEVRHRRVNPGRAAVMTVDLGYGYIDENRTTS